jgi:hypothetical protein
MRIIEKFDGLFLATLFLIALPLVDSHRPALAENPELSKVVFYVQ